MNINTSTNIANTNLKILRVTGPDINNGAGCRVTIWVAGCSHRCRGCHNQWTWDYDQGMRWDECEKDVDNMMDKSYIRGITVSGGDPLDQSKEALDELANILKRYKEKYPDKDIWLYTGFTYDEILSDPHKKKVIEWVNVIVDGLYIESCRDVSAPYRGSTNQKLIYL